MEKLFQTAYDSYCNYVDYKNTAHRYCQDLLLTNKTYCNVSERSMWCSVFTTGENT